MTADAANRTPVTASQRHRYGCVVSPLARWYSGSDKPRISGKKASSSSSENATGIRT
jgi:hypothetical protein